MSLVRGKRRMHVDSAGMDRITRPNCIHLCIAKLFQPVGNCRRRKDWHFIWQPVERIERKMIGMRVRDENCVERGQMMKRNAWRAYSRKKSAKRFIKVGVGQKPLTGQLN